MEEDMLSGATDLRLNLSARGEWLSALKASLNGDLDIALKDGAVQGFNLRHKIDSARARLKGDKEPELIEKKTDFSAMSLSAQIRNGVLTSDDLDMQTPLLRVSGKGSVDLVKETLNYLVNAKLVTTLKGQQAGTADELSGLKIPLLISGPWLSPNVDLQLDEIFKARLDAEKEQLKQKLAKQKDALAQKLAAEKASLKAAQEKEIADKKAQLELKKQQFEAEQKAELAARKKEAEDKARKQLEDKLKKLF
jgi:AsmA protein